MKIGVACHDAGGAEILASFCARNESDYFFAMQGPAERIFNRKFGDFENLELSEMVDSADHLLTGTSGISKFELSALRLAKERGIRSKSFVDHWVNYKIRFIDPSGLLILPDVLVAGDSYAERMLNLVFPGHPIELIENAYWKDLKELLISNKGIPIIKDESKCIFLSEGLTEFQLQGTGGPSTTFDESHLLSALVIAMEQIDSNVKHIVIRLHPSEDPKKYKSLESKYEGLVSVSDSKLDLWEELAHYRLAIGFQSMALVIAMQMGLRVVSVRPLGSPDIAIPFKEIERLEVAI